MQGVTAQTNLKNYVYKYINVRNRFYPYENLLWSIILSILYKIKKKKKRKRKKLCTTLKTFLSNF